MKRKGLVDLSPVNQITVLLADDHAVFRKSLKLLVELDPTIKVVGEAKSGREAVKLAMNLCPQVIIMDIAMPLLNGLEATRQIMETSPATRVLMLSSHPDSEYVTQSMVFGASGYLIKQSASLIITRAIHEVRKGKTCFSMSIPKPLRDQCQKLFSKGEAFRKAAHRTMLICMG